MLALRQEGDVTLEWHRSAYRTISVSVSQKEIFIIRPSSDRISATELSLFWTISLKSFSISFGQCIPERICRL